MPERRQHADGLVDWIGNPLDRHAPGAALDARVEGLGHQLGAGLRGDAPGKLEPVAAHCRPAQQDHGRLAGAQHVHGLGDRRRIDPRARRHVRNRRDPVRVVPSGVGRQNQRRDLAGRRHRGRDRLGAVLGDGTRVGRGAHPAAERPRRSLDVRSERRIVAPVIGRVIADDVDDRGRRLAGVVQVREPVGEAGPEMEQGRRRFSRHARVAVRGAGDDALEQREHAAHALDAVERGDEMHLRGARVGEAHVDAAGHQGAHQALGAVHDAALGRGSVQHPSKLPHAGEPCHSAADKSIDPSRPRRNNSRGPSGRSIINGRKACSSIIAPIASSRAP